MGVCIGDGNSHKVISLEGVYFGYSDDAQACHWEGPGSIVFTKK